VAELQRGSGRAESRLIEQFNAGLDDDGLLTESADDVLGQLALAAAGGSPYALELLLGLITDHQLAKPAIARHLREPDAVEEVTQEVLIGVARSIDRFRGEAKFTTWLWALARNTAISEVRRRQAREAADLRGDVGGDAYGGQRAVSSLVAERDLLQQAIESLPPLFRETVLLRDVHRLSYSEIAARQGLAINTVRSRLSRGRTLLAEQLPRQRAD
jgi:RNA polymerase sigma-70 factor (ECF subfamily)